MARRDGDDPVWVGGCVGDVGRKEDSKVPVPLSLREAKCREPERVLRECKPRDRLKRTAVTPASVFTSQRPTRLKAPKEITFASSPGHKESTFPLRRSAEPRGLQSAN